MFELREIRIAYGDIRVVHGVSLQIEKGEIISLVGSNGAGKTTILKAISGLLKPISGTIHFEETRLDQLRPAQIVDLGVSQVPEGRKLFGSMPVEINLEMGAVRKQARLQKKENLRKVLDLFPILADRKRQLAGSLSGGEQQMLAIGRSLMSEPKLLIMDEPSLGLSPLLTKMILDTVLTIRKEGTTVLLVEQNLIQALKISDRGYILETGRIVQTGTGMELLQDEQIKKKYLGI
ncbi:MAG TPA: ABC transporter ATP-binding protein [Thermodesulfobacteriota bacterium]|nr:ABC transporter ATP-binding protein [Thermodesulfobacteriota bacterium]